MIERLESNPFKLPNDNLIVHKLNEIIDYINKQEIVRETKVINELEDELYKPIDRKIDWQQVYKITKE